jgi:hypothetical protein
VSPEWQTLLGQFSCGLDQFWNWPEARLSRPKAHVRDVQEQIEKCIVNTSAERMNSRWNGLCLPSASMRYTGCCRSTCAGMRVMKFWRFKTAWNIWTFICLHPLSVPVADKL